MPVERAQDPNRSVERRHLEKAEENLLSAKADFSAKRYNNVASRCYYAAFHAAVAFLTREGVRPARGRWQHSTVWREFSKLGKQTTEDALWSLYAERIAADYTLHKVSRSDAAEALRRAADVVGLAAKRVGREN